MSVRRSKRLRGAVATRGIWSDLAIFAVVGALASLHAWTRIEGTMAGYALSRAQAEHADLLRERNALRLELATRKGARRIEADARDRLGMVEAAPDRIFSIPAPAPDAAATATARAAPAAEGPGPTAARAVDRPDRFADASTRRGGTSVLR